MPPQITPRKFTNIPEIAEKDPTYKYIPVSPGSPGVDWSPADYKDTGEPVAIIMPGSDENIEPLSQTQPQNIPMDRGKFSQFVYRELGGNPWNMNINGLANRRFTNQIQSLWNHVFQGKIPWGGRLTDDQMKFWGAEKQAFYNDIYNASLQEIKDKKDAYTHAMAEFDARKRDLEKETPEMQTERELHEFEEKEKIKQEYKEPKRETGTLTESAVLRTISDHALYGGGDEDPEEMTARLYGIYLGHRKTGLSREEALNKTLTEEPTPKPKPTEESEGNYSNLWKK